MPALRLETKFWVLILIKFIPIAYTRLEEFTECVDLIVARCEKESCSDTIAERNLRAISNKMETSETHRQINLCKLPVGSRLIIQCKKDWRMAVVSAVFEESVILQICSPKGRTYRKKCAVETFVYLDGAIPFLGEGVWKETFAKYDFRW